MAVCEKKGKERPEVMEAMIVFHEVGHWGVLI